MELVPYPVSFNFLHHAHEFSYSFTIVEYESVWITEKTRKKKTTLTVKLVGIFLWNFLNPFNCYADAPGHDFINQISAEWQLGGQMAILCST